MTVGLSKLSKDPYLGCQAPRAARLAAACLQCQPPAPCTLACPNQADIPDIMRLAAHAACEGLALTRRLWGRERVEAARGSRMPLQIHTTEGCAYWTD